MKVILPHLFINYRLQNEYYCSMHGLGSRWRKLLGLFSQNTSINVTDLPDLPDSIIENILSRLSPKCIFECQRDSKALQVLTKTPYFTRMQLNQSSPPPTIILQAIPRFVSDGNMELYFIDAESHTVERKITEINSCYMQRDNPLLLIGSHDGFLLFTNNRCTMFMGDPVFYVWNPITNHNATFRASRPDFHVCGFYFCSIRGEYVLLLVSRYGTPFAFQTFNVGTKSCETVGSFSYPPSCDRPAVIVNKKLYWIVDRGCFWVSSGSHGYPSRSHFVVSFEFETEKFGTIGGDGLFGMAVPHISQVHLFKLEEELSVCDFSEWKELKLSVLNQGTKCWVKKQTMKLPLVDFLFRNRHHDSFGRWANKFTTEVLQYKKDELLLKKDKRIFIYNLNSNTSRRIETKGLEESDFQAIVHIDSLLSLRGG